MSWKFATDNLIFSSPSVTDLENDGFMEILCGSDDNYLYCLDYLGKEIWSYKTDNMIFSSPLIADINNDDLSEIIICSTDNFVYSLSLTGVSQSGDNPWYCFRGSILHTGWMDSDNDFIDDLTESYLSDPDYPLTNNIFPSFDLSNKNSIIVVTLVSITLIYILRTKRKRKRFV